MTERLLVVSTCGTSLLTNGVNAELRAWLTSVTNDAVVDDDRLTTLVEKRREELEAADDAVRRRMSAELNGIGAVLDHYKPIQVSHLLVHTDTELGRSTAELVRGVLGSMTCSISASGLRTSDLGSFRAAVADLTKQLVELVSSCRAKGYFVVFNLTGGFKSLNGYLQTLGMIFADRCVFLFEGAGELMEIPRLPVRLAELEELREHAMLFRRLAVGYTVKTDETNRAPELLLMEIDGEVTLSVLGDVVWAQHRVTLFAEKLHPPLSARVRVADAVAKEFTNLEADQKVQVNEALDEFSAYRDIDRPLLKSRKFKKLQGDPVKGSTHELYAWSDGVAGRLFGHYEGDVFIFDKLAKHLK